MDISKQVLPGNFRHHGTLEVRCLDKCSGLVENKVLAKTVENPYPYQDNLFTSSSMLSPAFSHGFSNCRTDWKDADGKTLKAIQEAQAAK